jgi:hypothetical protein
MAGRLAVLMKIRTDGRTGTDDLIMTSSTEE